MLFLEEVHIHVSWRKKKAQTTTPTEVPQVLGEDKKQLDDVVRTLVDGRVLILLFVFIIFDCLRDTQCQLCDCVCVYLSKAVRNAYIPTRVQSKSARSKETVV